MKNYVCQECGKIVDVEFLPKLHICQECRNKRTQKRPCSVCGNEIEIPFGSKIRMCGECKKLSHKNHFKNLYEKKYFCKSCGIFLFSKFKKGTKVCDNYDHVCDECNKLLHIEKVKRYTVCPCCLDETIEILNKTYQLREDRLVIYKICTTCKTLESDKRKQLKLQKEQTKLNNIEEKEQRDIQNRQNLSKRMKENNPMSNQDSVEKMKNTIRRKIENGELNYKTGSEHWLYKGNRTFSKCCRDKLYKPWILEVLKRDNFICTKCGATKNLQVHHTKPLRDIIKEVLSQYGIETTDFLPSENEQYDQLVEEVILAHKLDFGITLCKSCHEEEDFLYRPFKNKRKNNEN